MRVEAPPGNIALVRKERAHKTRVRPIGRQLHAGDGADRKKHEAVGAHELEPYVERHTTADGMGRKGHTEPLLKPARTGAWTRFQSRCVEPDLRYHADPARIGDANHDLGSRLLQQQALV